MPRNIAIRRSASLHIRMIKPLKDRIADLAKSEGKSLTDYVTDLIIEDLRRNKVSVEITQKIV